MCWKRVASSILAKALHFRNAFQRCTTVRYGKGMTAFFGGLYPPRCACALVLFSAAAISVSAQSTPAPANPLVPGTLAETVSAPPLTAGEKFNSRVVQSFGLRGLGGSLIGAAIGQARDAPHEWGQGVQGFASRYGSGVAGNLSRQTFAFALESAFHEDPRYFPSTSKLKKQRIFNAIKQVFICKTDSGDSSFAYGKVISQFAGGQFTNVWQPASTGSVGDGFIRAFIGLGADAAYNTMQEFLPFMRPRSLRNRP